jgi:hypothetical protein
VRHDQYVIEGDIFQNVFVRCRRCGEEEEINHCHLDVALAWAEEHELTCAGEDKP